MIGGMSLLMDVRPLRVAAYRRVWIGNGLSFLGYQVTAMVVAQQMWQLTRSSAWVGFLAAAALVPLLVFGLFGGAAADVVDRRRLLLGSSLVAWAATIALLLQSGGGSPVLLLVIVAVQSAAFAVSSPTRQAVLARIVPPDLLPAANTLSYTTATLAGVLGPLLAGLILATWPDGGRTIAYLLDVVLFTVSLWATWRLPPLPPLAVVRRASAGLRGVADGFRYLRTKPVLLLGFAIDILAMVLAMPRAVFPEVAETRFGGGAALGWLYASIAIGSVLGGLTSGWIGRVRRQGLALVAAVVTWGVAVAFAGLARSLWLAVLLLAVAGAGDLVSAVYRQSMLQQAVPDELRGRLQGVNSVVVAGGPRLGEVRVGLTAEAFGSQAAWAGGGFAAAAAAVLLAVAFPALARYSPDRR
jgi:MFS family permease